MTRETAEKTAGKVRGRPFPRGVSPNPAGRPVGARNRATVAMQVLFEGEAEQIGRVCVVRALAGDPVALRLVVERLLSPARERTVTVTLPVLVTVADLPPAVASLLQSVAAGELTPTEGEKLAGMLNTWRSAVEIVDLSARLEALELAARGR